MRLQGLLVLMQQDHIRRFGDLGQGASGAALLSMIVGGAAGTDEGEDPDKGRVEELGAPGSVRHPFQVLGHRPRHIAARDEDAVLQRDRHLSRGQVLQEAARDKVFAAGLPVGIDHPTASELEERPTRSIRDLAGKLTTDAVYEGDGLYSTIELYPHMAPIVTAMVGDIGLSIRAVAEVYQGEAAGRQGIIVGKITEAMSVDLVSRAGAGGRLVSLLESVKRG